MFEMISTGGLTTTTVQYYYSGGQGIGSAIIAKPQRKKSSFSLFVIMNVLPKGFALMTCVLTYSNSSLSLTIVPAE